MEAQHRNSEGEVISIKRVKTGRFAGQHVIAIHDDVTPAVAYHLLDEGTVKWLSGVLESDFQD